jgi:hypothetical protein
MPSVKIELGEQKQAIEAGVHLARIENATEAVSKAGNEMLKLEVSVGPLKFNSWVVFTTKNSRNVADFAEAIGKNVVDGNNITIMPNDCIGKVARVELAPGEKISEKTGKPYLEIKGWLPPQATDLESDEIPF